MNTQVYQQCNRCVMDTTDPQITFDHNGFCNHCTGFLKQQQEVKRLRKAGSEYLPALVEKIKRKGQHKKYDVLLGISGGVDSCYTAYLLKSLGLRTLLVHLDNGWNADMATANVRNVAAKLGFDFQNFALDWHEFRDIQLAFLKASVIEVETPTDIAILGALHRVAAKHDIRYIISGGNLATEGILPKFWHYNAKDERYFNAICALFGTRRPRHFPQFNFATELYYKLVKGIKIIYLLNYVPYDKCEAVRILEQETGWQNYGGKHHESRFTKYVQLYLLPKKFNIDYRKATFSSLICAGKLTRAEAIQCLQTAPYSAMDIAAENTYVAQKLGISVAELESLIDAPPKYYWDYPNDEKRLHFLYSIYRKYFTRVSCGLGLVNLCNWPA